MKKIHILIISPFIIFLSAFFISPYYSRIVLYNDATQTNLPTSGVTGPNMDAAAADLDNDGDLDIVLAREFAPNKLLFNNGAGVFTDATSGNLPQFFYDSEDIGIADFDNDDDPDIVFASEDNAVHEFYLNNGNGSFRNANNRLPNSIANSVLAQDINNDNKPDIILGNAGQDFILINNGDTTFSNETVTRLPSSEDVTQDMKLGDIDNDGDDDLIAGNEDGNKIYINNGSGIFSDETAPRLPASPTEETRKVTLADVDCDEDLDIFFANVAFRPGRTTQDRLLLNDGNGIFTDVTSTNIPVDYEQTTEGIFVDIDYDNDPDLITSNIFFNRQMKVFQNDGKGVFNEVTEEVLPPNIVAEGIGVLAADLNNDGLKDLYLINRRTAQQTSETDRLLIRIDTTTSDINAFSQNIPAALILHQNYPNPFNPKTVINYELETAGNVELKIYNSLGNKIETLINQKQSPGNYSLNFDGSKLSSGIYFYQISIKTENLKNFSQIKKMMLIK